MVSKIIFLVFMTTDDLTFVPLAVLKIKDKWISQQHIALVHERKKHDSVIIRGVGRCQILQGHTFSWIRGLMKLFKGYRLKLLKILGGGANAPLPPCSYAPAVFSLNCVGKCPPSFAVSL